MDPNVLEDCETGSDEKVNPDVIPSNETELDVGSLDVNQNDLPENPKGLDENVNSNESSE